MIGSLFAGTDESPGRARPLSRAARTRATAGWARSARCARARKDRYAQADVEDAQKLVPEGIEGRVPYRGPLASVVYQLVGGLRAGMGYTGCRDDRGAAHRARASCAERAGPAREPRARRRRHRGGAELPRRTLTAARPCDRRSPGRVIDRPPWIGSSSSSSTSARSTRSSSRGASASSTSTARSTPARSRSSDVRALAPRRHRALRRAGERLRRRRAHGVDRGALRARRADPRHLLRHAAHVSPARRQGRARAAQREYGAARRSRSSSAGGRPRGFDRGDEPIDVWMSHGDRVESHPAGLRAARAHVAARRSPRSADRRAPDLRRAVPPRGRAHAARRRDARRVPLRTSPGCAPDWTAGLVHRGVRSSASASRSARPRRVCGLSGGVDSSVAAMLVSQRDRRSARRASSSTTACSGRTRRARSCGCSAITSTSTLVHVDAARALPERAPRRHGPGAEAEDHRARLHRGLRRGGGASSPSARHLVQGTLYPDVIESVSFKGTERRHQEPPQRRRPARAHEARAGRAAARALQGRGARGRRRRSACRATCSGGTRSPARASPIRCLGEITEEKLAHPARGRRHLDRRDPRGRRSTTRSGRRSAVLLPVRTVGVMGDERTYELRRRAPRGAARATG